MKSVFKYVVVLILIVILTYIEGPAEMNMADKYTLISKDFEDNEDEDKSESDDSEDSEEEKDAEATEAPGSENVYCLYDQLNDEEKKIYDQFVEEIPTYCKEFSFVDVSGDAVWDVLFAVLTDHPEFFWLRAGGEGVSVEKDGTTTVTITPIYSESESVNKQRTAELNSRVDSIVKQAASLPTLYEKVLFVHDYMVDSMTYNHEEAALNTDDYKDVLISSTSYGSIINNAPICSGYSAGFQLIMQKLGIPCGRINGYANDGLHQWNYVLLDGNYYYMDVTWDDPSYDNGDEGKSYAYFCINEELLTKTHDIEWEFDAPECVENKYNYYVYNGWMMDTYDFETFSSLASEQIAKGSIEICFSSEEEYNKAVADIDGNNRIHDIENISEFGTYGIGYDDERFIIKIVPM